MIVGLIPNFYVVFGAMFLAGIGNMAILIPSNTSLQTVIPDNLIGKVMGAWNTLGGSIAS
ncbi:MAG: hypothetical protein ACE5K0_12295 [Candidatus Methanofastidiosia archaeon]